MTAAHPFRWLLTLVALLMPTALMTCRAAVDGEETAAKQEAATEVVFRHYI